MPHTTPEERFDLLAARTAAGAPFSISETGEALEIINAAGRTPDELFARAKELIAANLAAKLRWTHAAWRLSHVALMIYCDEPAHRLPVGELLDAAISLYAVERQTGLLSMELELPATPIRWPTEQLIRAARRYAEAIERQDAHAIDFAEMLVSQSGEYTRQMIALADLPEMDATGCDENPPTE